MRINRKALVSRHNVRLVRPDPQSPLSVGNGGFAFTADITGLQTFPEFYRLEQPTPGMPLGTQGQWCWYSMPNPNGYRIEDALAAYETPRGPVPYPDKGESGYSGVAPERAIAARAWLYANPQRLDLGRIGLLLKRANGDQIPVQITDLTETEQTLDIWQGLLVSNFRFEGWPVHVWTVVHPERDLLSVRIESPLLADGRLAVTLAFPYAGDAWLTSADWSKPECHTTESTIEGRYCSFTRILDDDHYYAALTWTDGSELTRTGEHSYRLAATGTHSLEFSMAFAPTSVEGGLPGFRETWAAAANYWEEFWTTGGAVDFSDSSDPRAPELERRVVLSQYLTAINCAGSLPPQETGLVCNSWHGKFHLEMHWWHAAHFVLWGRPHLLERSLPWYRSIMPVAQETARRQGYQGARWPKQTGPEGRESPSQISPFLIWQQPHPIYYAELLRRANPDPATLERYREIVFETAEFMASYPWFDGERFVLGPPLVPAQESYGADRATVINPTYELAYWYWGLETAQRWRERLGMPRDPEWERVKNGLAKPTIIGGIYAAIETSPYTIRTDHPSMLMALGCVPPTPLIDPGMMRRTLKSVLQEWDWQSTWGWDYPVIAMCAARLGDPVRAVEGLLVEMPKNTYLPNGHNLQVPGRLPLYLPGNGGVLMAVAMMAAGWDGCPPRPAPGFPPGGAWVVHAEGLSPMP